MRHSGRVWIAAEGASSATEGDIEVEPGVVALWINNNAVGEWSHASMRIIEADPGFKLSADGDEIRFVPDDLDAFLNDTAAIRFKSRMKPAQPNPTSQSDPSSPPNPSSPAAIGTATPPPQLVSAAKNPGVAAVLSFFWPGLGQIYNGEIGKGVLFIVIQVINAFLTFIMIGFITGFIVWILGMVDAYQVAERHNAAHAPTI